MPTFENINITRLISGGLITNYSCTSRCRHCLYRCSPDRDRGYVDQETARDIFKTIMSLGCSSVHIGGGEPFLNVPLLKEVLMAAAATGMGIDYIETNSSWHRDRETTIKILEDLKHAGLTTLLISISPFHNEYIPFKKVKGLMASCRETGISIFPWVMDFYNDINSLDDSAKHSLDEYHSYFGSGYIQKIPERYWIHYGGRAVDTYSSLYEPRDTKTIVNSSDSCSELADTSHFHADLHGCYIPGLCTGLAIAREDLGSPLDKEKYPLISVLYNEGVKGFLELAEKNYGFIPGEAYLNKCHLCLDIRDYMTRVKEIGSVELQPADFYKTR